MGFEKFEIFKIKKKWTIKIQYGDWEDFYFLKLKKNLFALTFIAMLSGVYTTNNCRLCMFKHEPRACWR